MISGDHYLLGYEQLLTTQQYQHKLELDQKDAENAHLKACLDFLEQQSRRAPGSAGARAAEELAETLRTQEEAATLLMAAKHKELELLAGLLQMREQQIEDFRQLCEAQQQEIHDLKKHGFQLEDASLPHHGKEEQHQLEREVRRLRLRMEELEAAMGEQHDRGAGLAHELEAKTARIKVLEQQVAHIRSPNGLTWPEAARSPNGSAGVESPGFGVGSFAGSYLLDGNDLDQARLLGSHGRHHPARARDEHGAGRAHAHHDGHRQTPAAPSSFGASPPSLALPPLQTGGSPQLQTAVNGGADEAAEASCC
jgi:hypothetical protein